MSLCDDVLEVIASFLNVKTLYNTMQTSRTMSEIGKHTWLCANYKRLEKYREKYGHKKGTKLYTYYNGKFDWYLFEKKWGRLL